MENKNGTTASWIILILGIIGGVYSAVTISKDLEPVFFGISEYTYTSPLTGHEKTMIVIAVISAIAIIGGLAGLGKNRKSD